MAAAPDGDLTTRVAATGLFPPGARLIVLVSGGRDSVCLLDLAARLCGPAGLLVLHVNYGLRPAAEHEQALVREHCDRLGVALLVHRAGPAAPGNLHAWAREVRLGEAHRLAGEREALIALGHTHGDQAETILYRLAAAPSRRALLGMAERNGSLVRPLLGVTRAETAAYCAARGLAYGDDPSNDDPRFARARVRNDLLPALERVHPGAAANVVRAAALLRAEAEVLDATVAAVLDGADRIALVELAALPAALARLVLLRLVEDALGALVPQAAARLPEVLALAPAGGSAALDLGGGARALVEAGVLRIGHSTGAAARVPSAGKP